TGAGPHHEVGTRIDGFGYPTDHRLLTRSTLTTTGEGAADLF
ncbi:uncharacterized protein METZ01_LOCUS193207, partial [marine metagenome]